MKSSAHWTFKKKTLRLTLINGLQQNRFESVFAPLNTYFSSFWNMNVGLELSLYRLSKFSTLIDNKCNINLSCQPLNNKLGWLGFKRPIPIVLHGRHGLIRVHVFLILWLAMVIVTENVAAVAMPIMQRLIWIHVMKIMMLSIVHQKNVLIFNAIANGGLNLLGSKKAYVQVRSLNRLKVLSLASLTNQTIWDCNRHLWIDLTCLFSHW